MPTLWSSCPGVWRCESRHDLNFYLNMYKTFGLSAFLWSTLGPVGSKPIWWLAGCNDLSASSPVSTQATLKTVERRKAKSFQNTSSPLDRSVSTTRTSFLLWAFRSANCYLIASSPTTGLTYIHANRTTEIAEKMTSFPRTNIGFTIKYYQSNPHHLLLTQFIRST